MNKPAEETPPIHLNLRIRGMEPSATVALQERSNSLKAQGREIFKLGLGQSPFPVPEIVVEELRKHAHQKDYLPVKGLLQLREVVAANYKRDFGIECGPEDVIVGPGSKELMFLLQLVYYGDIVIPTPAWVSYKPQARIIGRQVHHLPTLRENKWKIVPEQIEELCASDPSLPRLLILNYPSNPGGGTYGPGELEALAKTARKYGILLLSDEIYGKLNFYGNHQSIVSMYPEGTIFSSGLSKWCGAGGWRLGLFVVPPGLRWLSNALATAASETFTSTSAPIQYAAVRAFQGGPELEDYLAKCRRILKALGTLVHGLLEDAGVEVQPPLGGFYLFPDFTPLAGRLAKRGITDPRVLCERLLEDTGVAILPGTDFGRAPWELTARLAYVDFDGTAALLAAESFREDQPVPESFVREHCSHTVKAIERMCEWLGKN